MTAGRGVHVLAKRPGKRPSGALVPRYAGRAPEYYQRYLVPLLFRPFAAELADVAARFRGATLLELACGTGATTQALLDRAPGDALLISTDASRDMLAIAAGRISDPRVTFRTADASDLPFEDVSFDAAVSAFGAMFYPDRPRAYAEAARVLRRGGTIVLSTWDAHIHNEFARTVHQTVAELFPQDPPPFLLTPYRYTDINLIRSELEQAGFDNIHVRVERKQTRAPNAQYVAKGLILGTPLAEQITARTNDPDAVVAAAASRLATQYGDPDCTAMTQAILVEATSTTGGRTSRALEYASLL